MTSPADQRWHYRRSLASRVTLLTTIAVGLAVAAVALGAFVTVRSQMQSSLDESLAQRARQAARSEVLPWLANRTTPSWLFGAADVRIAYVSSDRRYVTADQLSPDLGLGAPEVAVARRQAGQSLRTETTSAGVRYRVVAVPAGDGWALVIAQSMAPQDNTLRKLGVVLLIFGLAGVLLAALAGWAVARNGLRPVRRLTASVERIARTERLEPLQVEGADEIARLGTAFNQMLAALSASRDRQRRLVADAGHELRTPLTSLRTNLDLLAQAEAGELVIPPDARAELLDDVAAQIEELTTLIGDLVELSRDDPGPGMAEEVDLAEVVEAALVRVRRRSPGVTFDVELEPWEVRGESHALERAVTNLLDNAAKWSPPDGTVTVRLADGFLTVDDQGPGISPADLPRVFDRFYRAEESRSMPGSGLGLSIVRQVAERHHGSAHAGAAPGGGARLTLRVPGSPPAHLPTDAPTASVSAESPA